MVADGLKLVEPLADVEVNVPGVMARLAAPVVIQLRVLLEPEEIVAGLAANELIVGTDPLPEDALDEVVKPQPASPAQTIRIRTIEQTSSPEESRFDEFVESMRDPKQTQSIAHAVVAVALRRS